MAIEPLFDPTVQRALPLSRGADLKFSVFDNTSNPPPPWPPGTKGIAEIDYDGETIRFDATLTEGRLDFVLNNERTDKVPATTSQNKVAWRLRVALADDPTNELPVYEGPVYRGRHG